MQNITLNARMVDKVKNGLLESAALYAANVKQQQKEYETAPSEVGDYSSVHPKHIVKAFMDQFQEKVDMCNTKYAEVEKECDSLLVLVNVAFGDSHQPRHIRKFLINLYNPNLCSFDNTNLNNLDYKLMRACLDVLSLNCKGYEVYRFIENGDNIIRSLVEIEGI